MESLTLVDREACNIGREEFWDNDTYNFVCEEIRNNKDPIKVASMILCTFRSGSTILSSFCSTKTVYVPQQMLYWLKCTCDHWYVKNKNILYV